MQETERRGIANQKHQRPERVQERSGGTIESRKQKRKLWDAILFTETMTEEVTEVKLELRGVRGRRGRQSREGRKGKGTRGKGQKYRCKEYTYREHRQIVSY